MIKMGLSEEEITEVCGKPTIKSKEKPKQVVEEPETNYNEIYSKEFPDKLGIRGNEGNLSSIFLNPPKVTDTRLYIELGQVVYSSLYNILTTAELDTVNYYTGTSMFIGIDSRLFDENLHYISFAYSTSDRKYNYKTRYDSAANPVYYNQFDYDTNNKEDYMTLEYIHYISETFLLGISYNSTSLKTSIEYDYQWYNSETNSTSGLNSGSGKYESKHDYTYQSFRLQKVKDNLRFDFHYHPEVTSKENYSGDYTGESTTGFGRLLGLNVTKLDYKNDISIGYYKVNENKDISDPEGTLYKFGCNFEPNPDLVFKGLIDYGIFDGITDSVNPWKSISINGKVLFVSDLNTFSVNYIYINQKNEDFGDSTDKYRTDELFVNIIKLGFITNL